MDLGSVLTAMARTQAQAATARVRAGVAAALVRVVMGLMALALIALAVVFATVGAYQWLIPRMSAPLAALAVAGGLIVLALVAVGIGALMAQAVRRRVPPAGPRPQAPSRQDAGGDGSAASPEAVMMTQGYEIGVALQETLAKHPGRTVALGLIAGLAVAVSPSLRKAVGFPPPPPDRDG